ncbi:MAG: LrgB family protein [Candidatus Dactylopiibacterium sp.]|nr:LrgB family protein [Candidatus Dactylopiibacterium sp.]
MSGVAATGWLVLTVALYFAVKRVHARYPRQWLAPFIVVPVILIAILLGAHVPYASYASRSHWLSWMLGPATVAFAVPIYDHRAVARRHWLPLAAGVVVGMGVAFASSVALAHWLQLPEVLERSLAVRSISTPFAMMAAPTLGGTADLAAIFVVVTGVVGMLLGDTLLKVLPLRSRVSAGALFGAGAHAAGTAAAHRRSTDEGVIASLTMIVAGVLMVILAPFLTGLL